MIAHYHRQITLTSLNKEFSLAALETIITYNLKQDSLRGLIGHPEYHYDGSLIAEGNEYVRQQRHSIWRELSRTADPTSAWQVFGRITHAVQDFYAHSNYIALWLEKFSGHAGKWQPANVQQPRAHLIEPLDTDILEHPELKIRQDLLPLGSVGVHSNICPHFEATAATRRSYLDEFR